MDIIYTSFFLNTKAKEEKTQVLKGYKSWKYQLDNANFFFVTFQGLPYQKTIVAKISKGWGSRGFQ